MEGTLVAKSSIMQGTIQMVFVGSPRGQNSEYVTPITITTPSVRVSLLDNYTSDNAEILRLLLSPTDSDMNEFLG